MTKEEQIECLLASVILPSKTLATLVKAGKIKNPEVVLAIQALQFAVPEMVNKISTIWPKEDVVD